MKALLKIVITILIICSMVGIGYVCFDAICGVEYVNEEKMPRELRNFSH